VNDAVEAWATRIGLRRRWTRPANGVVRGGKQSSPLPGALIRDPEILLLDETLFDLMAAIREDIEALLTRRPIRPDPHRGGDQRSWVRPRRLHWKFTVL